MQRVAPDMSLPFYADALIQHTKTQVRSTDVRDATLHRQPTRNFDSTTQQLTQPRSHRNQAGNIMNDKTSIAIAEPRSEDREMLCMLLVKIQNTSRKMSGMMEITITVTSIFNHGIAQASWVEPLAGNSIVQSASRFNQEIAQTSVHRA